MNERNDKFTEQCARCQGAGCAYCDFAGSEAGRKRHAVNKAREQHLQSFACVLDVVYAGGAK